jgi:hypothetical protein
VKKKEYDGGAGRSCDDRRHRKAGQAVEVAVVDNNNSCTISVVEGPPTIAQPLHWLLVLLRQPTTVITVKCSVNAHALSPSVVCDRDQCTLSSSPQPVHTGRTDGQVAGVRLTREKFFALWRQRWSPFVRLSLFTSQSPDYASGTRSGYPWRAEQLGRVTPCKRLVYPPQMSTGAVPIRKSSVRLLRDITFIVIYTLCCSVLPEPYYLLTLVFPSDVHKKKKKEYHLKIAFELILIFWSDCCRGGQTH